LTHSVCVYVCVCLDTERCVSLLSCCPSTLLVVCLPSSRNPHTHACAPPPPTPPLTHRPNVVCTPHLGASTMEAQEGVSTEVAEAVIDALQGRLSTTAVNAPLVSAEVLKELAPYVTLAEGLGKVWQAHRPAACFLFVAEAGRRERGGACRKQRAPLVAFLFLDCCAAVEVDQLFGNFCRTPPTP
jgi:hypothetical protein